MNSTPSMNPGSFGGGPLICPRCGAPALQRSLCHQCGAPLNPSHPPPLPAEYAGLPRPKVSSSITAASFFMIVFGLFWTTFSAFFLVTAVTLIIKDQQTYALLSQEGQTVQGVVTQRDVDDSGDTADYLIYYRYTAPLQGVPHVYEQKQAVRYDLYASLRVGAAVPVVYAASRAEVSRLKDDFHAPEVWPTLLMGGMGLLFVGIGLFMLAGAVAGLQDYFRLKRHGQEAFAVVFDRWEERDSDGDALYQVAYAFRAFMPDGSLRLVTRAETHRQAYQAAQVGSTLTICYLPNDPETCKIVAWKS